MVTILKWVAVLILTYIATTNFKCHKICGESSPRYTFNIGIEAYPDVDSMQVGDTLFLQLNVPTILKDLNSSGTVNFSGAENLGTVIRIMQFLNAENSNGAVDRFNYVFYDGSKVDNRLKPANIQEYLFLEKNRTYNFKLAIIPQKPGKYLISISNAANVFRQNDKCTKANFIIDFKNTDQHLYYLELWRPDLKLDESGAKKVYYFKVVG